jgi:Flp pilus assembly protein TadB
MNSEYEEAAKLTRSERRAQEWRAIQPYGTRFIAVMAGGFVIQSLELWVGLPIWVDVGGTILWSALAFHYAFKMAEIRKRRDAEQKEAMKKRWRQEDEQLYQQPQ